jgi:hypothetical protein
MSKLFACTLATIIAVLSATKIEAIEISTCDIQKIGPSLQKRTNGYQRFSDKNYFYKVDYDTIYFHNLKTLALERELVVETLPEELYIESSFLLNGQFYFSIENENTRVTKLVPLDLSTGRFQTSESLIIPSGYYSRLFEGRMVHFNFKKIYVQDLKHESKPKLVYSSPVDLDISILTSELAVIRPLDQPTTSFQYVSLSTGAISKPVNFDISLSPFTQVGDLIYLGSRQNLAIWNMKTEKTKVFPQTIEIMNAAIINDLFYKITKYNEIIISPKDSPNTAICSVKLDLRAGETFVLEDISDNNEFIGSVESWTKLVSYKISPPKGR